MIFTNGELWEAVSVTGEELLPGTQVIVTAIKGLQLMVRAANADEVTRSRRSMANAREVVPTSAKVTA
jgi:hypothetical protein